MIEFVNVSFTHPASARPALRNVSLRIPSGAFALITGASGCGKSTLLRCVNGLVPHFSGGHFEGTVRVNELDPIALAPQGMSRHAGMVLQDPEAQFVMDTVDDEIAFALENAALARTEIRMRVEEALDLLGLSSLRNRALVSLSGGEKQRVAIASALALRPGVLMLDEPTSQLDPVSAEDVLNALARLNSDLGLTILLSEHRLDRVMQYADVLVCMQAGAARQGTPQALAHELPHAPPVVELGRAMGWSPIPFTVKHGRVFSAAVASQANPGRVSASTRPVALALHQVHAHHNKTGVLKRVSMTVGTGELVALMGRNGSGKTTLLRAIVGLHKPTTGHLRLHGQDLGPLNTAQRCQRIGYLPQDPNAMLFADSVRGELEATLKNHKIDSSQFDGRIAEMLEALELRDLAHAYPRDLSTGERQRVALGAIAITQPAVLLLDEPTRGLDGGAKHALGQYLRLQQSHGVAILLVTHDVEFAAELADRVVVLSQGGVIADGAPTDVLSASPVFSTQVAKLFPGSGWLTVAQALDGLGHPISKNQC